MAMNGIKNPSEVIEVSCRMWSSATTAIEFSKAMMTSRIAMVILFGKWSASSKQPGWVMHANSKQTKAVAGIIRVPSTREDTFGALPSGSSVFRNRWVRTYRTLPAKRLKNCQERLSAMLSQDQVFDPVPFANVEAMLPPKASMTANVERTPQGSYWFKRLATKRISTYSDIAALLYVSESNIAEMPKPI